MMVDLKIGLSLKASGLQVPILVIFKMVNTMVLEHLLLNLETNMKENLEMVKKMGKDIKYFSMETNIKEVGKIMEWKEEGLMSMLIKQSLRENFRIIIMLVVNLLISMVKFMKKNLRMVVF